MKIIKDVVKNTHARDAALTESVAEIIANVRENGDKALIEYAKKFDNMDITGVKVDRATVEAAYEQVDQETIDAIRFAADQIRFFAEKQLECLKDLSVQSTAVPGLELGHKLVPVERCGCYVPAGRHPLPSTALMSIIPAKVAGVKEIATCSPPFRGFGTIHPAVLVAMDIAGADEIFSMGGAQGVGALAYGTETVKKVDLIVGPGNKFVAEAKRQVYGDVGIDSIAGPSEVLVLADHTANPKFVAIDLLAQAEHDPNAKPILVSTDQDLIDKTLAQVDELLEILPTADVARASWNDNGQVFFVDSIDEGCDLSNEIAPEHLEVEVENEREVADKLLHFGSMFVGHYAPVAFGDFVSGTNHTLPTMSNARYSNGLWVGSYIKVAFCQFVSEEGCRNMADACMKMANLEGLIAHSDSVRLRVE